jgi:hypothetical protein
MPNDQNTLGSYLEPASILFAFVLAYFWVSSPLLREYSLQLASGLFLIYFISKRLQQSKWNHLMPSEESLETALLVGAVAVVVGSTDSLGSPFLPLFYLLLFVSVMTINLYSNLVEMVALLLFLWAVSVHPLTTNYWLELLSLPLLLPLMLFARWQFEEAQEDKYRLKQEENLLAEQESRIMMFLSTYLVPRLRQLRAMLIINDQNRLSVAKQLEILEAESGRLLQEIDQADDAENIAAQVLKVKKEEALEAKQAQQTNGSQQETSGETNEIARETVS